RAVGDAGGAGALRQRSGGAVPGVRPGRGVRAGVGGGRDALRGDGGGGAVQQRDAAQRDGRGRGRRDGPAQPAGVPGDSGAGRAGEGAGAGGGGGGAVPGGGAVDHGGDLLGRLQPGARAVGARQAADGGGRIAGVR